MPYHAIHSDPASGGPPPRRRLRIVLADDDRDTIWTLSVILRDEGHEVHGLTKGGEVVDAIRRHKPDVVVLDLEMPDMSGYAVARLVRETFGKRGPMLVAYSGRWAGQIDRLLAKTVGFDHFVAKTAHPRDLLTLLEPLRDAADPSG